MTDIILIRHGETEWNKKEIFRGTADVALNETGIKQAELLAERLREVKLEAVYASPLSRAAATATRIAGKQNLKVQTVSWLSDMNFGDWQGLSLQEVASKYPDLFQSWLAHPEDTRVPGGETIAEISRRVLDGIKGLIGKHTGRVVLVTHRVPIKIAVCALLGLDNSHFWNIQQDNAAITIFSYRENRFVLMSHNDTCHLRPLQNNSSNDF